MNTLRPDLEALPERMRSLPVDKRGFVVPWFVDWINGEPEFRAFSPAKMKRAIQERLCWVCGHRLGSKLVFVVGPMCGVNRVSSEPPSHLECAQWSAKNCPFLSKPQVVRRVDESGELDPPAGIPIMRNPGVTLLWVTASYAIDRDPRGAVLFDMGPAIRVEWWREGRAATRAEVEESVATGLPLLIEMAEQEETPGRVALALGNLAREALALEALYP